MIRLINVSKRFKSREVLKKIDLELSNNNLITILGKSGSGKSTLLNILGGLDKPTSGEILYDDKKISDMDFYREKNIAYIFQESFLLNEKTVFENLYEYLLILGITNEEEVSTRIDQALEVVKLKKYKKHIVNNLSRGEQQRIAIAKALLRENKIIFADEPTANLDIDNTVLIMDILKYISQKSLVVLVTHNKTLALKYSNKIYELEDGIIISEYTNSIEANVFSKRKIKEENPSLKEIKNGDFNIRFFNLNKLDIDFYLVNGQIYYKTNQIIKKLEESSFSVLSESEKTLDNELEYSLIYNDTEKKKKKSKEILLYFLYKSKLFKLNRIFLAIIGILLFFISYFLIISSNVDDSQVRYTESAFTLNKNITNEGNDNYLTFEKMKNLLINNEVTDLIDEKILDFYLFINEYASAESEKAIYVPIEYNNKNLLFGKDTLKNSNEIIISRALADSLRGSISLEDLLNYSININGAKMSKKIVGITNSNLYEAFYFNEFSYSVGPLNYTLEGEDKRIRVIKDYSSLDIRITRGDIPKRKNEILALDDGKTSLSSKIGEYIISGFYEFDESIIDDEKYEYILSLNSTRYREELSKINKIYNSKNVTSYIFRMNSENSYKNVYSEKDYQYNNFYEKTHNSLVSFTVPVIGISILIIGYIILISYILVKKYYPLLTFERVVGKRKLYLSFNIFLSSLFDAIIFIGISYVLSSFLIIYLIDLNKSFNMGISLYNPYQSFTFYTVLIGMIIFYSLILFFNTLAKLSFNVASLMKKIKK